MTEKSRGPKCKVCGRPLRDPVSIAIGAGPTCRGSSGRTNRRALRRAIRKGRKYAYDAGLGFSVGNAKFVPVSGGWEQTIDDKVSPLIIEHAELGEWLVRNQLI